MIKKTFLIGAVIAAGILAVYRATASPTIGWVDSGVIAAAANTLGIPNPPGFPLYMLIAHLFTKIPWGSVVGRLQLLSQLSAVGIVGLVYWMVAKHAGNRWSALFAAVALAFSYGLWQQANNVETYTLTNIALFLILFLAWQEKPKWWLIGLVLGVSAGLNPIVIAIIPPLILVSLKGSHPLRLLLGACVAVVVAVATYSYLPIRAATHPFVNWGDPSTMDRLIKHLFGAGLNIYEPETNSINGFTGQPKIFWESFLHFWHLAIFQFTPILFPLVVIGAWTLYRKNRVTFWMLGSVFLANLTFVTIYYGGNQESWMITSWIVFAVFLGIGAGKIFNFQFSIFKHKTIVLFLGLVPLFFWYPILNHRSYTFADDYADNLYKNVPEGAIIVGGGDFFNSLTVYTHEVTKFRKDIIPVTGNMFYIFDWYRKNLAANTDITISASTSAIIKYKSVDEFTYAVDSLVADNPTKQVFVTPLLLRDSVVAGTREGNYHTKKYDLIPHGLLLKVVPKGTKATPDDTILEGVSFGKPPFYMERNYKNAYRLLRNDYAVAYTLLGEATGNEVYFQKAIELGSPDSPEFLHRLAIFYAQTGKPNEAKQYFEASLAREPGNAAMQKNYQTFLGSIASASANLTMEGGTKQTGPGISFTTPNGWTTARDGAWTVMTAAGKEFSVRMRRAKRPASVSIETFLGSLATISGQLLEQGPAKIPNTDLAYVKVWSETGQTKLQFFLFIADAVVEIIVGPADSPHMRDFDAIVSSLKLL